MQRYVMLSKLGPEGYATLQEDPERLKGMKGMNAEVEAMGVKVIEQYGLLGQYDFLNILEAPDELLMARVATALAARGTLKRTSLTAIPVDELIDGLRSDR